MFLSSNFLYTHCDSRTRGEPRKKSHSKSFYQPLHQGITRIIKPRGLQYRDPYSHDGILGFANEPKQPWALINAALLATLSQSERA